MILSAHSADAQKKERSRDCVRLCVQTRFQVHLCVCVRPCLCVMFHACRQTSYGCVCKSECMFAYTHMRDLCMKNKSDMFDPRSSRFWIHSVGSFVQLSGGWDRHDREPARPCRCGHLTARHILCPAEANRQPLCSHRCHIPDGREEFSQPEAFAGGKEARRYSKSILIQACKPRNPFGPKKRQIQTIGYSCFRGFFGFFVPQSVSLIARAKPGVNFVAPVVHRGLIFRIYGTSLAECRQTNL